MSDDLRRSSGKNPNTGFGHIAGGSTRGNKKMHKTAIVILNWNGLKYLKLFLKSVTEHSSGNGTIIYVADNGSTDGSVKWISDNFTNITLIRFDTNYGFAEGYNRALSQIDAEYYVLLNSDIEVTPGWLGSLVSYMDNNPDAASCQPKILSYHKRDHFEYAGAAGGFIDKYGYPFCRGRLFHVTEKDQGQYDNECNIFWSSGACMIVRAEAWKKCNGFDGDFFAHMEEIDLCWRFHNNGYRVGYVPGSSVYHVGGGMLPYDSPFKTYLNFRNSLFLLYKNLPGRNFHKKLFIRKSLDGLAAVWFLLNGRLRSAFSVLKAHCRYYKDIPVLKQKREIEKTYTGSTTIKGIMNKSIILEFYIKRNKCFSCLKQNYWSE
jgi:GT2 family glycosyltransferase